MAADLSSIPVEPSESLGIECVWVKQPQIFPKPVAVKQEKQVSWLADDTSVPSLRDHFHHASKKWKQPAQAKKSTRPLKKEKLTEPTAVNQGKQVCRLVNETSLPHRANNPEQSAPSKTKIINRAAFESQCTRYQWLMEAKATKPKFNDFIKREIRRQFLVKMIASGHISAD